MAMATATVMLQLLASLPVLQQHRVWQDRVRKDTATAISRQTHNISTDTDMVKSTATVMITDVVTGTDTAQ